jgi:hypothetical protein
VISRGYQDQSKFKSVGRTVPVGVLIAAYTSRCRLSRSPREPSSNLCILSGSFWPGDGDHCRIFALDNGLIRVFCPKIIILIPPSANGIWPPRPPSPSFGIQTAALPRRFLPFDFAPSELPGVDFKHTHASVFLFRTRRSSWVVQPCHKSLDSASSSLRPQVALQTFKYVDRRSCDLGLPRI